ncbi:MAG: hypothetical protein JO154_24220 [Chitinophaga sp.]|uniref:sensor histidine kinase n=1 Tax=Chitinophaga sp. TaxID=1869181 RepID=UPI0025B94472|nr:HAMP domain-containing sensor histidine kinase [Chitinophaga sp.]MBV8255722.1 hypothetical protein [Chitinophaga sp.]
MTELYPYLKKFPIILLLLMMALRSKAQTADIVRLRKALEQTKDSIAYVDGLNRLATLYQACQLDSCGAYANKAVKLASSVNYDAGLVTALRNMGSYYAFKPNRYLSYIFYNESLTAARAAGDSASVAMNQMNIAIYHQFLGQRQEAVHLMDTALKRVKEVHNDSLRALVLANYYIMHAADTGVSTHLAAVAALDEAADVANRYHDFREVLYTRLLHANEEAQAGHLKEAFHSIDNVIDTAAVAGLNYMALYGSLQMAGYKSALKQPDSLVYYNKALDYALKGGYGGLMRQTLIKLYEHSMHQGDTVHADYYAGLLKQVLLQEEDTRKSGAAIFMDFAATDRRLDSLKMQHLYQRKVLATKSTENIFWRYFLIFLLVMLILLTSLLIHLFQAYRVSRNNSRKLAFMQRELNERTEQLKINDDFKNKLISLIAHDFRSPLNNIISISNFVEEDTISLDDAKDMILQVDVRAKTTLQVFDGILRWMHTQLSGFVYQPIPCVVKNLIGATISTVHLLAEKKLQIELNIDEDLKVMADYEMLQFVHRNFLHNAAKFTPDGMTITVTAIRENDMIKVAVIDEGSGIDATVLPNLFSVEQTTAAKGRKHKGAGVALIICKDFIEKMNGHIGAENNSEKGATFFYSLPAAPTT